MLLPVGAIVGRYLRHWDPLWFYLHVCIQSVGFILGLATAITGKVVFDRMSYYAGPHQKIGTIILVLSIFQVRMSGMNHHPLLKIENSLRLLSIIYDFFRYLRSLCGLARMPKAGSTGTGATTGLGELLLSWHL